MTIGSTLAAVAAWMLTYLVHSTIFIGGAILLARRLRERPEHMSGVWKVALVGGVLTASVQLGFGVAPIGGSVALLEAPVRAIEVEAPPMFDAADAEPVLLSAGDLEVGAELPVAPIDRAPSPTPALHATTSSAPPWWTLALAVAGLLGAALGLLSVGLAIRSLRRRLADRTPLVEGALVRMLRELMMRSGLRRRVGLSVCRATTVPLAMGITRPEIVLPERATHGLATSQQHTMLAHELAHVFRHDPAWRMVALLAERVFFFQPLNRIAAARMAECAEYLCDDWAARHTDERLALAQCLTEVASWVGAPPVVLASAMAGSSSQLRHRVLRLLAPARPAPRRKRLVVAAALAIAAVAWLAPGVSSGESAPVVAAIPRVAELVQAPVRAHDDAPMQVFAAGGEGIVIVRGGVATEGEDVAATPAPSADPKASRKAKRRATKANREANRALDKAMRKARKEGRAAPPDDEVARILSHAREQAGQREASERFELHLVLPSGSARIEIEGGADRRVVTVDELVAEAHRRHGHGHGHARGHAQAYKQAIKRAQKDLEHARRRMQQQLRTLPPAPPSPPGASIAPRAPRASRPGRAAAPPAPPHPFAPPAPSVAPHAPPPSPFPGAVAPPAPSEPPGARVVPFAPRPPRARSPRTRARAPHDLESI